MKPSSSNKLVPNKVNWCKHTPDITSVIKICNIVHISHFIAHQAINQVIKICLRLRQLNYTIIYRRLQFISSPGQQPQLDTILYGGLCWPIFTTFLAITLALPSGSWSHWTHWHRTQFYITLYYGLPQIGAISCSSLAAVYCHHQWYYDSIPIVNKLMFSYFIVKFKPKCSLANKWFHDYSSWDSNFTITKILAIEFP